jgi:AraC-like DNA-binding protein
MWEIQATANAGRDALSPHPGAPKSTKAGRLGGRSLIDNALHDRPRVDVISGFPQSPMIEPARGGLSPCVLRRVLEYIDANLEKKLHLAGLATLASLSHGFFVRAFRQSVGETPHRYLLCRRLEKALELLAQTETPLVEIALETGFADQSHFSRRFREYFDASPCAFRRAKRSKHTWPSEINESDLARLVHRS